MIRLIFCIVFWTTTLPLLLAQPSSNYQQSFDVEEEISDTPPVVYPKVFNLKPGIMGSAMVLRNNTSLKITPAPRDLNDLTVSFLFKPLRSDISAPLFSVEQNKKIQFSVNIHESNLIFQETNNFSDTLKNLSKEQWYFCTLLLKDNKLQVKIQSTGVFDTYNFSSNFNDQSPTFIIGGNPTADHSEEVFLIDELKLFNKTLSLGESQKIFSQYLTKLKSPVLKVSPTFKDRENKIQDNITTSSQFVYLEIWDNDKIDKDRLSIFKDELSLVQNFTIKKKKARYRIELTPDTTNQILFFAENMGEYDSYNTAALKVIAPNTTDSIYSVAFNLKQNAIFEIRQEGGHKPKETTEEIKPQDQLDEIKTKEETLTFLFKDHATQDNDEISFKLNDDIFAHTTIDDNEIYFAYDLKIGKNEFIIQPKETKFLKCTPEITIRTKKGEVLLNKKLKLGKKEAIKIPIRFSPPPSTKDSIIVNQKELIFHILDPKGDGDVVSIFKDDELILDHYKLKETPLIRKINIDPSGTSIFKFRSDATGKVAGNTCRIEIYYPDAKGNAGKKISEVQVRSFSKEDPAILEIIEK